MSRTNGVVLRHLPEKASFPDRFKFSLAGLGAGLALAFVFGVGMEFVDDRIRNEQDLIEAASLPVLAEIPPLPTDREIAAQRWKPWQSRAPAAMGLGHQRRELDFRFLADSTWLHHKVGSGW